MAELEDIKQIIRDKIIINARKNGHIDVANILEGILKDLSLKNTTWTFDKDIENTSCEVKEGVMDYLLIQTRVPDWFERDKKIIENQIEDDTKILTLFSESIYPIDHDKNSMEEMGITTGVVHGLPSLNISQKGRLRQKGEVTLYHIDDPMEIANNLRIAITISGRAGKKLASKLAEIYSDKFRKASVASSASSIDRMISERIVKIHQNNYDFNALNRFILTQKCIHIKERISLSIFFRQFGNNRFVEIDKIAKDLELNKDEVVKEIADIRHHVDIYDTKISVDNRLIGIKLKGLFFSTYAPRLLFHRLDELIWEFDQDIREIYIEYGLNRLRTRGTDTNLSLTRI